MPRPDRHHCPGLNECWLHPRWFVTRYSYGWGAFEPWARLTPAHDEPFATHADAMTYATTRARAQLYDAIQNQPQEVTC